jgi:hypothetical protein
MDQYVALTRELFLGSGNVKSFKTLVAMNQVKTGMTVPVDHHDHKKNKDLRAAKRVGP